MKVLVISDTHGRIDRVDLLIEMLRSYGLTHIIHGGDCITDVSELQKKYPDLIIEGVPGNCDFSGHDIERHRLIHIDGVPIFLTHGDRHHVKYDYEELYIDALAHEAKVAIFGHTHSAFKMQKEGMLILNPGSLTKPRDTIYPSFAILEIEDGEIKNVDIRQLVSTTKVASHPYF